MRHGMTVAAAVLLGIVLVTGYGAPDAHAETAPTTAGSAGSAAGVAWNQDAVSETESTVRAHTPVFPHRTCEITDPKYASLVRQVTDGQGSAVQSVVWYYGDAINAAIADCHARGGGVVVVPASGSRGGGGVYYSGAITLLSNVDLQVDTGATIKFVRNPSNAYYPVVLTSYQGYDLYDYSPLVYALNQENIALTGGGTLDAQDNVGGGWALPSARPGAPSGTFAALGQLSADGVRADQRIFTDDGSLPATIPVLSGCPPQSKDWGPCASVRNVPPPRGAVAYASTFEPQFVEFNHSADVLVQGVHLVNTLFWEIHPLNSRDVLVRNVTVDDTAHLTDDGIDPESCDDVEILDNSIITLDDGISVKSGRNRDGRDLRAPSENILIKGNTFDNPSGGSASISIGSEMSGGVYDVYAEDNTSGGDGTAYLLKIKTNSYRGGVIQGIYVRDSTMTQTIRGVLNLDTNYGESNPIPDTDVYNPVIRDIYLDDDNTTPAVTTTRPAIVVSNADARAPFDNVVYENSVFYTPATFQSAFSGQGGFFSHLTIRNVRFVNPQTGAVTWYDTTPVGLIQTTASAGGATIPLTAVTTRHPNAVTPFPADEFTLSGTVDLAADPDFLSSGGTVSVYADRDTTPVPVTVSPDGSFTSGPITLNNDEYWYTGRHYVAVSLASGIDVDMVLYQVSVPLREDEPMRTIALEEHFWTSELAAAPGTGILARANGSQIAQQLADLDKERIADMDASGIDMQIVSHVAPGTQGLPGADGIAAARRANDQLAAAVARHPGRLAGFAAVPTASPEAAADELERAVGDLGFVGGLVNSTLGSDGAFLDDPRFDVLLSRFESLDVPLYLHPSPPPDSLREILFSGLRPPVAAALSMQCWGWHAEAGLHTLRLVMAGVFDRHPGLRLIIGHCGEMIPFMLARIDAMMPPPSVTGLASLPSEYFLRNIWVTTSGMFSVPPVLCSISVLGIDRVLFSVDYPFGGNAAGRAMLDALPLSPADNAKVAGENAEKLLGLA